MGKVVVTGLGLVTPLGHGIDSFWEAVLRGDDGFSDVTSFDTSKYRVHRGAEIKSLGEYASLLSEEETASRGRTS